MGTEQRAVQVWDDEGGRTLSENVGNDTRGRITRIASRARSEVQDLTKAFATAGKEAARLTRRYPLQIFAGALVLGFVIGRARR
jgi:hypothetical protein